MNSGQEGKSKVIVSLSHVRSICLAAGIQIFQGLSWCCFLHRQHFTVFDAVLGNCQLSVI